MEIISLIVSNLTTILGFFLSIHGLALVVVNATPTPLDNNVYGKFYRVVEFLAGILSVKVKEYPGEADWKYRMKALTTPEDEDDDEEDTNPFLSK